MEVKKIPDYGCTFNFPENEKWEFEDNITKVTRNLCVQMADQYDDAVIQEIARTARAHGASDVVVMNKNAILEALERRTPKKPKEDGWLYCPVCGKDVLLDHVRFCPDCGQAIDWEDDNGEES